MPQLRTNLFAGSLLVIMLAMMMVLDRRSPALPVNSPIVDTGSESEISVPVANVSIRNPLASNKDSLDHQVKDLEDEVYERDPKLKFFEKNLYQPRKWYGSLPYVRGNVVESYLRCEDESESKKRHRQIEELRETLIPIVTSELRNDTNYSEALESIRAIMKTGELSSDNGEGSIITEATDTGKQVPILSLVSNVAAFRATNTIPEEVYFSIKAHLLSEGAMHIMHAYIHIRTPQELRILRHELRTAKTLHSAEDAE